MKEQTYKALNSERWAEIFATQVPVLETIARGSIMYLALFILLRVVLKRQSSTLGVSDLLVVVLIADASQNAMGGDHDSILDSLILVCTILFWAFSLDWLGFKVPFIQKLLRPPELPLIKNGKVLYKNLRKELITMDELMSQVRHAGCETISCVRLAFMEGDGRISVIAEENGKAQQKEKDAF